MITIEFKDFDDMLTFARTLTTTVGSNKDNPLPADSTQTETPLPAVPTAPTTPITSAAPVVPQPAPTAARAVPGAPGVPTTPSTPATHAAPQPVPTTARTYTPDELARAAMALMDSGRQQELLGLLAQFGVDSLPALQPSQYGGFATALRGLGAQI